ncbi:MHYT domain-containing protein [Halopseudomonas sp.]
MHAFSLPIRQGYDLELTLLSLF